jgi:hypothetical protein
MDFFDVFVRTVCVVFFGSIGYVLIFEESPPVIKYGSNTTIYQKVFHDCVVEVKGVTRNTSTVEDDDSSDMIKECRYAASAASYCVVNGKECV